MSLPNYYKTLEVSPIASYTDIKTSYYRLALLNHPDKNNSAEAHVITQGLNLAWEILGDVKKRTKHDRDNPQFFEIIKGEEDLSDIEQIIQPAFSKPSKHNEYDGNWMKRKTAQKQEAMGKKEAVQRYAKTEFRTTFKDVTVKEKKKEKKKEMAKKERVEKEMRVKKKMMDKKEMIAEKKMARKEVMAKKGREKAKKNEENTNTVYEEEKRYVDEEEEDWEEFLRREERESRETDIAK